MKFLFYLIFSKFEIFLNLNRKSLIVAYKYENRYIKCDLTPILRQNLISLKWNKDNKKISSNSGTKFVPFKLYLAHRRSLEKISSYFDTFPVLRNNVFFPIRLLRKDLIASQSKPWKGGDIKWILIENIYSFHSKKKPKKTVYVFNQYPFNILIFSWF